MGQRKGGSCAGSGWKASGWLPVGRCSWKVVMKISAIVILARWPRLAVKFSGGIISSKWIDIHSPGKAVSMTEIVIPDITAVSSWPALLGAPHPSRKINKLWLPWPTSSLDNKILGDGRFTTSCFFLLWGRTCFSYHSVPPLSIFPVLMGTNALTIILIH